jgi:hypothetical protein
VAPSLRRAVLPQDLHRDGIEIGDQNHPDNQFQKTLAPGPVISKAFSIGNGATALIQT